MHICVSGLGVESISNSRLVGDINISQEEAEKRAAEFLKSRGYKDLELQESKLLGAVCNMCFSKTQGSGVCLDNCLSISIAMDDGSLYDFNALRYSDSPSEAEFKISEEEAAKAIPGNLKPAGVRKAVRKSPGGRDVACYEFSCSGRGGRGVKLYVDGESGKQFDIIIEEMLP